METKKCTKCEETKSLSEFHLNSKSRDGRQQMCKACVKDYGKLRVRNIGSNRELDVNNPLSGFSPRQLMQELARRGYRGELSFVQKIDLQKL